MGTTPCVMSQYTKKVILVGLFYSLNVCLNGARILRVHFKEIVIFLLYWNGLLCLVPEVFQEYFFTNDYQKNAYKCGIDNCDILLGFYQEENT